MKKCLILGGCGFIGSHLADKLLEDGHEVRIFDRPNVDISNVAHIAGEVEILEGDFTNEADVAKALEGMEVVYHLISTTLPATSNQNPAYDIESNLIGTIKMLDAAVKAGIEKIIFSSSGGTVYGPAEKIPIPEEHPTNPISSYGIHKLAIEKYLALYGNLYGLDWRVLRPSNPYGERQNPEGQQGAVAVFASALKQGKPITIWGDGSVVRDYIYVKDVVRAFAYFAQSSAPSRIYNISTGIGTDLNRLVELMAKASGLGPVVKYLPARKVDIPVNVLDNSKAKRELGWEPSVTLFEGLKKIFGEEGCSCGCGLSS